MLSEKKERPLTNREFDLFLTGSSSEQRASLLVQWRHEGRTLDDKLLKVLMTLPISQSEIVAAIEMSATSDKPEFELWVMNHILAWDQNVAAVAIRAWARVTDRVLWHRLIPIASIAGLPQRIRFTILDIAKDTHGYELTKATLESPEWEDLSGAFHNLLIQRALEYDLSSDRLTKLCWTMLKSFRDHNGTDHKPPTHALAWLMRHECALLEDWMADAPHSIFFHLAKASLQTHSAKVAAFSRISKGLAKGASKNTSNEVIAGKLPALWSRNDTPEDIQKNLLLSGPSNPEWIAGMSRDGLTKIAESQGTHPAWARYLIAALPWKRGFCPDHDRTDPFAASYQPGVFPLLEQSRSHAHLKTLGIATDLVQNIADFCAPSNLTEANDPHPIFDLYGAFQQQQPRRSGDNLWAQLGDAWLAPDKVDINALSSIVRKHKGVAAIAHIKVLARFKNRDDAVLKLLDYIRSDDSAELRAVAKALGEINTKRSLLELISMLTRPNATVAVQQDIVNLLSNKDLKDLQKELRSAVHDIKLPVNTDHPLYQIKDELSALLTPAKETERPALAAQVTSSQWPSDKDLDRELGGMIPHYKDLSSEVKRALRTALFFNQSIAGAAQAHEMDLSPLIDMQYKAMELLYREFFEEAVSQSLQKGHIQRKLDVIGYARPIVRQMDDFEAYIAALPVVKDIPFFSKFKLRKMLRAICQFEPGRRFTLDGLKAFGLYFLVFGRQNCKAGLSGLFNVGTNDDVELANFCRELHIFQDFRNRAAHEGFHPDASNDIQGIWRTTASVVQWAFKIKSAQKSAAAGANLAKTAS
jgi:hypothetical protein